MDATVAGEEVVVFHRRRRIGIDCALDMQALRDGGLHVLEKSNPNALASTRKGTIFTNVALNLDNNTVKLTFNQNLLEVSASGADGEAHESIAVEYEAGDKPVSITFNSKFLTDPLKALDEDTIFFEFKDEVSPGVIKTNDNFRCVVMPLRLG